MSPEIREEFNRLEALAGVNLQTSTNNLEMSNNNLQAIRLQSEQSTLR